MFELMDANNQNAVIKVLGVGGGGGNAVRHMVSTGIDGVWRQPLRGGSPERVTHGWRCSWDSFGSCRGGMVFSADGDQWR